MTTLSRRRKWAECPVSEKTIYTIYGELPESWFNHPVPENRFVGCLVVEEPPLEAVSEHTGRPIHFIKHAPLPIPPHLRMMVGFIEQPGQVSLRKLVK